MVTNVSVIAAEVLCCQMMAPSVSVHQDLSWDQMESVFLTWSVDWMMIVLTSNIVSFPTTLVVILVSNGHVETMLMAHQEDIDVNADVLRDTQEIHILDAVSSFINRCQVSIFCT